MKMDDGWWCRLVSTRAARPNPSDCYEAELRGSESKPTPSTHTLTMRRNVPIKCAFFTTLPSSSRMALMNCVSQMLTSIASVCWASAVYYCM